MKLKWKKLLALALTAAMALSTLPATAMAVTPTTKSVGSVGESLSGSQDLIAAAIAKLQAEGKELQPQQDDKALEKAVEAASGLTLNEVKSTIGLDLFANRETGVVETAIYQLDAETMDAVMELVLKDNFLTDKITYEYILDEAGKVLQIKYEMQETFALGLDELEETGEAALADAVSELTEEAEREAAALQLVPFALPAAETPEESGGEEGEEPAEPSAEPSALPSEEPSEEPSTEPSAEPTASPVPSADPTAAPSQEPVEAQYTVQFLWERVDTPVLDENGDPVYRIGYSAEYGLSYYPTYTYDWNCTGAVLTSIADPTQTITLTQDQIMVQEQVVDLSEYAPAMGLPEGTQLLNSYKAAVAIGPEGAVYQEVKDITMERLMISWGELTTFNAAHADYYGVSTPYWTSKQTDATPLGAMLALISQEPDAQIPSCILERYIPQMSQLFMAAVIMYGDMLLAVRDLAMEAVEGVEDPVSRLLILHDWMANMASFDMNSIMQLQTGGSSPSPLSMTPFGIFLSGQNDPLGQLSDYGVNCLGYAAGYAWLVQNAFPEVYKNADGSWKSADEVDHMVDIVKIKFDADVAASSVAGDNSGFGGQRFNEPHYFNAVKVTRDVMDEDGNPTGETATNWYYVDACYNDISVEVFSQYRVETEGNISHMYFLVSPTALAEQFEGNYDYIDSLYDGGYYEKTNPDPNDPTANTPDMWEFIPYENGEETAYDDRTFQEAWFSGVVSQIIPYNGYWYYVDGMNYLSMMDSYEEMGDIMDSDIFGDLMESMGDMGLDLFSMDNQLKRRPMDAPNEPAAESESGFGDWGDMDWDNIDWDNMDWEEMFGDMDFGSGLFGQDEDPYGQVIFDYGTGDVYFYKDDSTEPATTREGLYADLVAEDQAYRDKMPDLNHSLALYDGELYLNLSNQILTYDLSNGNMATFKEYEDVYAATAKRPFGGTSFAAVEENDPDVLFHFRYLPLASISIHDDVVLTIDAGYNVVGMERNPTFYATLGTNLTNSYAPDLPVDQNPYYPGYIPRDEEGNEITEGVGPLPYVEEALNYNPEYNRYESYMGGDDSSDSEEPEEPENSNVEFMWCANIVDAMTLAEIEADTATKTVTVAPWCGRDTFTEVRTANLGLTTNGQKTVTTGTALNCHYLWNEVEQAYICVDCKDALTAEEASTTGAHILSGPTFQWSEDYSACTAQFLCTVDGCGETFEYPCTITAVDSATGTGADYTATARVNSQNYASEPVTVEEIPEHEHTYGEPAFQWSDTYAACTAQFDCTVAGCPEQQVVACSVSSALSEDKTTVTYTAVCTFNGSEYQDVQTVTVPAGSHVVTYHFNNGAADWSVVVADGAAATRPGDPVRDGYTFNGWYTDAECTAAYDFAVEGGVTADLDLYAGWTEVETPDPGDDNDDDDDNVTVPDDDDDVGTTNPPEEEIDDGETPLGGLPFTDVPADAWFAPAVEYVYGAGYMTGISDTVFAPNMPLTRSMMAQILYNMEGRPDTAGLENPFTDVPDDAWYAKAVTWAASEGVVAGVGQNLFQPEGVLTREQLSAMLYRYQGSPAVGSVEMSFTDAASISDWAQTAMEWAVSQGVLSGKGNGILDPLGQATRAEVAQMLMNFAQSK